MIEIERRFLVTRLPEPLPDGETVVQGYLCLDPAAVRVRRRGVRCTLTIKTGNGLLRNEFEREITSNEFEQLWPAAEALRITKTRHLVPLFERHEIAELDIFGDALEGHQIVEVEFDTADEARAFDPPDWFGTEVTDDGRYTNAALARHGWPAD